MSYQYKQYKTVWGCRRKIGWVKERIEVYKERRGKIGNGTFWEDVKAVDDSIFIMEMEIAALEYRIQEIKYQIQ
jgi:hypothetical protein